MTGESSINFDALLAEGMAVSQQSTSPGREPNLRRVALWDHIRQEEMHRSFKEARGGT